jgi:PAS domain S-box-containing protein
MRTSRPPRRSVPEPTVQESPDGTAPALRPRGGPLVTARLERLGDQPLEVALVAGTDHAVVVADTDGVIRFWNPAAEAMFGHAREDAVGSSLDLIIPEKLRDRHWDGYNRVMETGQTEYGGRTLAVPALRRDGTRISVEFTVTLLTDRAGAVVGIGAILRDVTARWEEQRALNRRVAELERELAALRVAAGE